MANVDITISQAEYGQLMTVLTAWKNKLEPLRVPLAKVLRNPAQRQKLINFAKTDNGRLLKQTYLTWQWLNQFFEDINWREDD